MWSVDRYHIFGDSWDWSHAPCRIQLKAMARVMDRVFGYPTPIFKVKQRELEAVRSGERVPRDLVNRCLMTDPSIFTRLSGGIRGVTLQWRLDKQVIPWERGRLARIRSRAAYRKVA